MSHTFHTRLDTWRLQEGSAMITWTRVHAIMHQRTCAIEGLSDMLDERHVAARNGITFHRTAAILIAIFLQIRRLAMELPDGGLSDSRSRSDGHGDVRSWPSIFLMLHRAVQRFRGRTPRSRSDRTAIAARSSRDRGIFGMDWRRWSRRMVLNEDGTRRGHDRGSIASRSWSDRCLIATTIKRDRGVYWSENQAKITANSGASKSPEGTAPTTPANRLHDRSNDPRIRAKVLFKKACILPSLFLTFDRFVKELSEFQGRSLFHCDPPAFRLNSEGIGAGLITNSSLISSNFPLEFRKSVRKDLSKFTLIRANWSLILVAIGLLVRFDRLSRGNLSFY